MPTDDYQFPLRPSRSKVPDLLFRLDQVKKNLDRVLGQGVCICSWCKKILYMKDGTEGWATHGICSDCQATLRSQLQSSPTPSRG